MTGESDLAAYTGGEGTLLLQAQNGAERFSIGRRQPVAAHLLTMLSESMKPKWTRREISQRIWEWE